MNSSNNSNYAPSSESKFGFNSPPLASGKPAAAPAPSSRPRLLKVRKQSASQHPRSTNTFLFGPVTGSGTGTRVGDLGSNPFQSSSYAAAATSVFGNTNTGNVGTSNTFLFGVNSNLNSQTGSSCGVVDDLRKLNIGSENVKNATMFNSSGNPGDGNGTGVRMDVSVVAELPNEIRKLNIDGKTENVGSSINDSGVDPRLSASSAANHFSNAFGSSGIAMELPIEMKKMNIDDARDVSRGTNVQNVDSAKSFEFGGSGNINDSSSGKLETVLPIKMMNLNLKDSLNKIEKSSFDSGSSRSTPVNVGGKAENLISDELRKLKVGIGAGDASGNNETKLHDTTTSSMSASFSSSNNQTVRNDFDVTSINRPQKKVEFAFTSRLDSVGTPHVEFKTPNIKGNLFSGVSSKLEAKKGSAKDPRLKKKKGKLRKPTADPLKLGQDFISRESSLENSESFEAYSPMDVSPYQETLADNNTYSRETSVASDDASHFGDNYASSESRPTVTTDEDLITATHRLDINEGHAVYSGKREEVSENSFNKGVGVEGPSEESVSGAETESFKSAAENLDYSSDTFVTATDGELNSTATTERQDSDDTSLFTFSSNAEDNGRRNFKFAASSSIQGQPLTETRHHKKKHRPKIGHDSLSCSTPNTKISYASASVDFLPVSGSSTLLSPSQGKKGDVSNFLSRHRDKSEPAREQGKEKVIPTSAASTAAQEACEKWRLRGNQAYGSGDLSKAEDYYTQGVNSVSQSETSKSCLRALMLCYSNRAATRMSLGRLREALKDCLMAAALDSNFLKVQVRAANCYLALGEVEDALLHFMRCLQSGSDVCADRKILVEASEGLEKAQKVSDNIIQSTELLRRKTQEDVECALKFIDEALQISTCSEKLLEMKADALLMLRKYEQVIQLCEQTLTSAENNSSTFEGERNSSGDGSDLPRSSSSKIWRLGLIVKSYFYLGRLDEALDFVKKQEDSDPLIGRRGSMIEESVISLADTIRELLSRKAAGNEAFQSGKHAEAVDHYTAALSRNVESRPFAAICFCNRAAAYRAMGQITDAIADCSLAIALDGNYLKAISRRAGLFELIRDYGQAATDYRRLVTLLNKLVEDKVNQPGGSDKLTYLNELRKNQQRLSVVEEEDRKEVPLNMYLILGVEPSAAAPEIKKAYRKAALKHHPDKAGQSLTRSENGDDGLWREIAEEVHKDTDRLFKMIGEAYAVLSNPTKRSRYDLEEEKRKEASRFTRSGTSRMYEDAHNYPFEPSSNRRQWQEAWRQYSNSQSRGPEKTRTSRYP